MYRMVKPKKKKITAAILADVFVEVLRLFSHEKDITYLIKIPNI